MEKHIYFVRHGESESNVDRVIRGREAKLTDKGMEQARAVADRFASIKIDAIITSPFVRAADTAVIIGERIGLAPEENELFGEWLEPSHLTGLRRDHPLVVEMDELLTTMAHNHDFRHGDEETFAELVLRAEAALRILEAYPADRICVVTHGAFLCVLLGVMTFGQAFTKREFADVFWRFEHSNTGITYALRNDRSWQLVTWNDQSHLG